MRQHLNKDDEPLLVVGSGPVESVRINRVGTMERLWSKHQHRPTLSIPNVASPQSETDRIRLLSCKNNVRATHSTAVGYGLNRCV